MTTPEPSSNKRLAYLEQLTSKGTDDPLAWYGLAMEYRKLERWADALAAFTTLRSRKPDYVAMYLMCGQMLDQSGKPAEARAWFDAGLSVAKTKGDSHAASELESAISLLPSP